MTDARDEVLEELVGAYGGLMITWYTLSSARAAALAESCSAKMAEIHAHVEARVRAARGEVVATARFRHTRDRVIAVADVHLTDADAFTAVTGYPVEIVRRLPGDATGGTP